MQQHAHFISTMNVDTPLHGEYDAYMVVLSYLVAVLAGFCALSIIRFMQSNESVRLALLLSGGTILGLGIWSMHFTAMLAFSLPIAVLYDAKITFVSVLPAILVSILFLHNLNNREISTYKTIYTGLILAVGIACMHFIGMSAMSMKAYMSHDIILTIVAIIISWGLAVLTVALNTTKLTLNISKNKFLIASAFTFGFSVASMHYLAMSSTYFFLDTSIPTAGIGSKMITIGLIVFTVLLMTLLILVLFYKKKISRLLQLASSHHMRVVETIDNMQDGFILSDDNNHILLVNKKFQQAFGANNVIRITINDNLSTLYEQLVSSYFQFDNVSDAKKMLAIVNSKKNLVEPFKVLDKEQRWWLLRQNRTSADTIIQTWTDITAQIAQENDLVIAKDTAIETLENLQNTQEELLEAKKMASLGSLVSGVAHELNTPLGIGITSLSSIMEIIEKIQSSLTAGTIKKSQLENALKTVLDFEKLAGKSLDRMAKLIQQFKYISVDQDIENSKTFFLINAVSDIVTVWQATLNKKHITFNIDIANDIKLFGFENALIEVLSCLISNSIEHAFEQSTQGIINIVATQENSRLRLVYSDNGRGIAQHVVNRVFEPFVTTKRSEGGIGLGLHIAYNLVNQKLKGKIKLVNPTTDYKTVFTLNLPIDCSQ